jgi:hypothetical protein
MVSPGLSSAPAAIALVIVPGQFRRRAFTGAIQPHPVI